mgnify:CR=1 FL=1
MPVEIIWEERGVCLRYSGVVTAAEFLESIFTVQSDPRFDALAYSVLDTLDVTGGDVSRVSIKSVAAHSLGALNSNASIKVVTCRLSSGHSIIGNWPRVSRLRRRIC